MSDSPTFPERKLALSKTKAIKIKAHRSDAFDHQLWAVNWLNTKRPALYNLYSKLVYPNVAKVGGRVLLKGVVTEKISGDDEFDRELLLIVRYQSVSNFLKMIGGKVFRLKSLLRTSSVSRFVFGFMNKIAGEGDTKNYPTAYDGDRHHLVHIFQTDKPDEQHHLFEKSAYMPTLYFYGLKAATVARLDKGGEKEAKCFVDGICIWQADSAQRLRNLVEMDDFKEFSEGNKTNSVYLFERTI
ncbi:MAG: hypothetical protein Roseis2KO_29840 [Roseivirga sp.]